jgi:hypothetical protein
MQMPWDGMPQPRIYAGPPATLELGDPDEQPMVLQFGSLRAAGLQRVLAEVRDDSVPVLDGLPVACPSPLVVPAPRPRLEGEQRDAVIERLVSGDSLDTIERDLGVAAELGPWSAEVAREMSDAHKRLTPPAVLDASARSQGLRSRAPETTAVFMHLIQDVFAPEFKCRGYRKRRQMWWRPRGAVWPVLDVQRWHSTGDPLTFTLNWKLHVPGYGASAHAGAVTDPLHDEAPLSGRIGDFTENGADTWWSIHAGLLARFLPPAPIMAADAEQEIQRLLVDELLPFLDRFDDLGSIVTQLEEPTGPLRHWGDPDVRAEAIRRLRAMQP